jgi:hypothetical protein
MSTSVIPPSLLNRLQELRPILLKQGIVQMRTGPDRQPGFRLRFRQLDPELGAERHFSISLPDQTVAEGVATLINSWRVEERQRVEQEERQRQTAREQAEAEQAEYRELVSILVELRGGKRRMRDRALKALKEAAKAGPWELLKFGNSNEWLQPGQPGRPPKPRYR